ncbi:type II secretion system F family protein [Aquipuribacter nitratireducens]|uniref:Type II secretion system F family protein n=1 Tax=Aquipuribacter nitratireducens TaxID=650104 RepID=A0ABW0GQA1_9MICO
MPVTLQAALVAGALGGLGLFLVVRELVPSSPRLDDALERLRTQRTPATAVGGRRSLQTRLGEGLVRRSDRLPLVSVPTRDLAVLRVPAGEFLGEKALLGLIGLAFPPVATLLFRWVGLAVPLAVPAVASLGLALALFHLPDLSVRARAARARDEFARAVGAYLELVALERRAGSGPTQALTRAATVADAWPFVRIRQELVRAQLAGTAPWTGLGELATELGVPALEETADIVRLAGEDGGSVYEALRARGRGLRAELLSKEQARANATTQSLGVPVAALGLVFSLLLFTPAVLEIL